MGCAVAQSCDRCGFKETLAYNNEDESARMRQWSSFTPKYGRLVAFFESIGVLSRGSVRNEIDLCPTCCGAFEAFMKEGRAVP